MVIVDTGFWLALANPKDHFHKDSVALLKTLKRPLITTWPVLTETCHLLVSRLGVKSQQIFLKSLLNKAFQVFELKEQHYLRIYGLIKTYADLPMDLADASLVVLAEELSHGDILSTDTRDFKAYRWKQRKPFNNLCASFLE